MRKPNTSRGCYLSNQEPPVHIVHCNIVCVKIDAPTTSWSGAGNRLPVFKIVPKQRGPPDIAALVAIVGPGRNPTLTVLGITLGAPFQSTPRNLEREKWE